MDAVVHTINPETKPEEYIKTESFVYDSGRESSIITDVDIDDIHSLCTKFGSVKIYKYNSNKTNMDILIYLHDKNE